MKNDAGGQEPAPVVTLESYSRHLAAPQQHRRAVGHEIGVLRAGGIILCPSAEYPGRHLVGQDEPLACRRGCFTAAAIEPWYRGLLPLRRCTLLLRRRG